MWVCDIFKHVRLWLRSGPVWRSLTTSSSSIKAWDFPRMQSRRASVAVWESQSVYRQVTPFDSFKLKCFVIWLVLYQQQSPKFITFKNIFMILTNYTETSGGAHLRGLAPGQHSYEETSQRWWLTTQRFCPRCGRTGNFSNNESKVFLFAGTIMPWTFGCLCWHESVEKRSHCSGRKRFTT